MAGIQDVLRNTPVNYVVAGGRAYLALVDPTFLASFKDMLKPKWGKMLETEGWDITILDRDFAKASKALTKALLAVSPGLKATARSWQRDGRQNDKITLTSGRKEVASLTNAPLDDNCRGRTNVINGVKYLGYCDALVKLTRAAESSTFAEKQGCA